MSCKLFKNATLSILFIAAVACALLILAFAAPQQAWAITSAEKQAEAQAALASMNALQDQLEEAVNVSAAAQAAQEEAEQASADAQAKIDELNDEIASVQGNLSSRAYGMYREGQSSMLDCLLGAESFQEFVTYWDLLNSLNDEDVKSVAKVKDLRAEVQEQKTILDEQTKLAAEKAEEAEKAQQEICDAFVEMQTTYENLSAEVQTLMQAEYNAQQAAAAPPMVQGVDYAYSSTDASTGTTTYYDANGNVILQRAYDMIGRATYNYGSCAEGYLDCSGFVSYCLTGSYTRVGSTHTFMQWNQVSDPQPGDICTNDGHCGIYIGNGQMIDCSTWGDTAIMIRDVEGDMIYVRQ